VISIAVGLIILAFDGLLWFENPKNGHAYALIAFTVIQLLLLSDLLRSRRAVRASLYWSTVYLLLLLLNPLTGPAIGISPAEFALYLFGLTPIGSFDNVRGPSTLSGKPLRSAPDLQPRRASIRLSPRCISPSRPRRCRWRRICCRKP